MVETPSAKLDLLKDKKNQRWNLAHRNTGKPSINSSMVRVLFFQLIAATCRKWEKELKSYSFVIKVNLEMKNLRQLRRQQDRCKAELRESKHWNKLQIINTLPCTPYTQTHTICNLRKELVTYGKCVSVFIPTTCYTYKYINMYTYIHIYIHTLSIYVIFVTHFISLIPWNVSYQFCFIHLCIHTLTYTCTYVSTYTCTRMLMDI